MFERLKRWHAVVPLLWVVVELRREGELQARIILPVLRSEAVSELVPGITIRNEGELSSQAGGDPISSGTPASRTEANRSRSQSSSPRSSAATTPDSPS